MHRHFCYSVMGLSLICLSLAAHSVQAAPKWKVVWQDQFNGKVGSPPNPANWVYEVGGGGWGNNELETYTNAPINAQIILDPKATDGKALAIRAIKDADGHYTSARLKTEGKHSWAYGRYEARLKIPAGQGIWPAFWMLGDDIAKVSWPTCGEIDIMESIQPRATNVYGTPHGPGFTGGSPGSGKATLPGGQAFEDAYHVYAVDWTPSALTWSVDGHPYHTFTQAQLGPGQKWVFDHPFFLLLNVAVGGGWPGNPDATTRFPDTLLVDYVRVSQPVGMDRVSKKG